MISKWSINWLIDWLNSLIKWLLDLIGLIDYLIWFVDFRSDVSHVYLIYWDWWQKITIENSRIASEKKTDIEISLTNYSSCSSPIQIIQYTDQHGCQCEWEQTGNNLLLLVFMQYGTSNLEYWYSSFIMHRSLLMCDPGLRTGVVCR